MKIAEFKIKDREPTTWTQRLDHKAGQWKQKWSVDPRFLENEPANVLKKTAVEKKWSDRVATQQWPLERVKLALCLARTAALRTPQPPLSRRCFEQALKEASSKKALGIEQSGPADFKNLPEQTRVDLLDLLRLAEKKSSVAVAMAVGAFGVAPKTQWR